MKNVLWLIIAAVFINCVLSFSHERIKRWSRQNLEHVMAPGFEPLSLLDPRREQISEKFNDEIAGLTVIKDPSFDVRACFITDLDPKWTLTSRDKMEIISSQKAQIIHSPMDFKVLAQKAGPIISSLCKKLHIFWMTAQLPLPLPERSNSAPPGLPSLVKAPPALIRAVHQMKTPPPLIKEPPALYHTFPAPPGLPSLVKAPPALIQAVHQMETPPPLIKAPPALYNYHTFPAPPGLPSLVKAPPALIQAVHQMKTPPPLIKAPPALYIYHTFPAPPGLPSLVKAPPALIHVVHQMKTPPPLIKVPPALSIDFELPEIVEAPVHQMKTPPQLNDEIRDYGGIYYD